VEISIPSIRYEVISVFKRFLSRMNENVAILPLICDWALFIHANHKIIDRNKLRKDLKRLGLWKSWILFGCIAVDKLGLSKKEYPFYDNSYSKRAMKILESILVNRDNSLLSSPEMISHSENASKKVLEYKNALLRYLQDMFHFKHTDDAWLSNTYSGIRQVVIYLVTR
jgi:hypothetical protein